MHPKRLSLSLSVKLYRKLRCGAIPNNNPLFPMKPINYYEQLSQEDDSGLHFLIQVHLSPLFGKGAIVLYPSRILIPLRRSFPVFMPDLLAAIAVRSPDWTPTVAIIMVACNVLAIIIGRLTIKYPNVGPQLPAPALFGGLSLPALLATTSFGHLLGAGVILGLTNLGSI